MSNIAAGRLRHRVSVEQLISVVDSSGFTADVWQSIGNFWAAIEPLSVREFLQSQQIQSQVTTRIIMRYNSRITASMRVNHRGTLYNIAGIQRDPDSGREWMTLPCTSGTNDG